MAGGLGHSVAMFHFLLYLLQKFIELLDEALFPPLTLPGVTLELLREYLLERSSQIGRISCFEEPVGTCCKIGGSISASQLCDAHHTWGYVMPEEESWESDSLGLSMPEGEIRCEALCGFSLERPCGQATIHT